MERKKWVPREGALVPPTLAAVREQILDCLVHATGDTVEAQTRYLDTVLDRAGAKGTATWLDLYRSLTILRDDSLAAGVDPQVVQDHVTKLHRILEQVDD